MYLKYLLRSNSICILRRFEFAVVVVVNNRNVFKIEETIKIKFSQCH